MTARVAVMFVLALGAYAVDAAEPGRLFFTPAQRATLDTARKQNIRTEIGSDESEKPAVAAAPLPQNISVNGMIRRSDGKNTIWINNRVINDRQSGGINATVGRNDNQVRLSVPESGRNVQLKVGQTVEILSGTVEETYLRRPAAKAEAKNTAGGENSGTDVAKVTPAPREEAVKSGVQVQKRPARAVERNATDEARFSDPEPK